jgi:hypothetical protein
MFVLVKRKKRKKGTIKVNVRVNLVNSHMSGTIY